MSPLSWHWWTSPYHIGEVDNSAIASWRHRYSLVLDHQVLPVAGRPPYVSLLKVTWRARGQGASLLGGADELAQSPLAQEDV